jgi:hypothetical protein
MRWLICIIPLFLLLACDNPLGPQPISGTFEGKNGGVFIPGDPVTTGSVRTWDITIIFSPTGTLNWSAKFQNVSNTIHIPLNMNINIFPDDSRTPGTELATFSNRNFDLSPLEQESVVQSDPTSLNPPPTEFYWTLFWGER